MARRTKIYEGKAKILYEGPEPGTIVQYFKDDATAYNAQKKDTIEGKGVLNNRLSEHFMTGLTQLGIPNHFIKRINMREQLCHKVEIIPLEVIVRNVAAGSMSKMLGIEEGTPLPRPIVEFCYKDDSLGDPLVAEEHILAFAQVIGMQNLHKSTVDGQEHNMHYKQVQREFVSAMHHASWWTVCW